MVGRNSSVSSNPACVGRYSFAQFKSSAVCYTNPLHTGRYLGIVATDKQGLSLCKVEVYSRGNVMNREFKLHVYGKRQTANAKLNLTFLRTEDEQIKTAPDNSNGLKNCVKLLIYV